jgi:hypothetical protein
MSSAGGDDTTRPRNHKGQYYDPYIGFFRQFSEKKMSFCIEKPMLRSIFIMYKKDFVWKVTFFRHFNGEKN